jgi:hypothetical protein
MAERTKKSEQGVAAGRATPLFHRTRPEPLANAAAATLT